MSKSVGSYPELEITISGSEDIGKEIVAFEWKSFVNGGYVIRAKVEDPYLRLIKDLLLGEDNNVPNFLEEARKKPTPVTFRIKWKERPDSEWTTKRIAFISDIDVFGDGADRAGFDFVAVDPPSWWLNAGNSNGKVYQGKVSEVIENVVNEYASGIDVEVSETKDNPQGYWPMMRQDPKTFIQSLLEWSSNLTNKQTHWIIASVDRKIVIKEQRELERVNIDNYKGSWKFGEKNDVINFNLLSNTFMSTLQTRLSTQGISSVSGKFLDKETLPDKSEIDDENTGNKINILIDQERGFKKPESDWSTSIITIPEHSGGEIGLPYEDYFSGRARNMFLNLLPMVMRLRVTLPGDFEFDDSSLLGVSTITLTWRDLDDENFFLSGKWLVYGFHHRVIAGQAVGSYWETDLYLYRFDWDAEALQI